MAKKPNVVLIYPDQMRYDCTSHTGNPILKTPGFDRLAQGGAHFQDAYTSFPLCCPFRASLMTGVYAHKHRMMTNHFPLDLDTNKVFLPELMKDNGYRTGWFGKWHLNGGNKFDLVPKEYQLGFDEFVGYSRGHNYLKGIFYRGEDPTPRRSRLYEPEFQTNHLIDFMQRSLDDDTPFCGMLCYGLPHTPVQNSPEYYRTLFSPEEITLSENTPPEGREAAAKFLAQYYGMVACVDSQIQRITSWLEDKGILDNTVFIVVSDHGDMAGEHGMYMKNIYHEASMHVPFVLHYPDLVKGNTEITQMVDPSVDIFPTILDLCGIDVPEFAQGQSLKVLIKDGSDSSLKDFVYYQMIHVDYDLCGQLEQSCRTPWPLRGFRTKDHVYIERNGAPFALYDVKNDDQEMVNLAADGHNYDILDKMHRRLVDIMQDAQDDWNISVTSLPGPYQSHAAGDASLQELYARAVIE